MRKVIFTLLLAIVSCVWMMSDAKWCMPSVRTLTHPWIEAYGTFGADGAPCEPNGACPNCITIVLKTSDKTYYLVTDDGQLIMFLDTIELGTQAIVSGIPFTYGKDDYIQVVSIKVQTPMPEPTDTIPVYSYTGDDPGSSTVDPVDPNQVVVTLRGDQLTIKDFSGDEITYSLGQESGSNAAKRVSAVRKEDTFRNSVSIELTEKGTYRLDLTNPKWNYRIYGRFVFPHSPQGIEPTVIQGAQAKKVLIDGQLFVLKNGKRYTLQGQEVL